MDTSKNMSQEHRSASLLLRCPLRTGLAGELTQLIYNRGGQIFYHDQIVDPETRHYYTALKWHTEGMISSDADMADRLCELLGSGPDIEWSIRYSDQPMRMAIFVSKDPWCLYDILARSHSGEWDVQIALIIGNHSDLQHIADRFGIKFHLVSINKDNKDEIEAQQLELLRNERIDLVVLARYMQILSSRLVNAFPNQIINIHHAFLPSFPGGKPYHAARERGVKMIGATSHYVTEALDAGPIIEQDVLRVGARHSVKDLIRLGHDVEKIVLARAIWSHIQRKVIVHNGRTIVFD